MKNKRDFIGNLSLEQLYELIENLLPKMGIEVNSKDSINSIKAIINVDNVGIFTTYYILFTEKLLKNYLEIDELSVKINKKFSSGASKVHIVTNHTISGGFESKLERSLTTKNSVFFWDIDDIVSNIEMNYEDYWRHNDQELISYETEFETKIHETFQIKKLVEYKAAYQKLLSIFIEPNLFLRTDDKQSTKKAFTKINIDKLIDENDRLLILHGDPGTGKTRLLNEIGKLLIKKNSKISGKKFLPVLIDRIDLRDAIKNNGEVDICTLLLKEKFSEYFKTADIGYMYENYQVVVLIDSIDEFEKQYKERIIRELEILMDKDVLVFLGTRTSTLDSMGFSNDFLKNVTLQKFNNQQVERFAQRYFEGNGNRANGLIESMKENKILDKLPLTPLNMSLMSILYEETSHEIPATLNDIYDKFSNLLLGRTMVNSRVEFLDITLKENILGTYALELLERPNGELMTKDEFITFFEDKLKPISGSIDMARLPEALDFIIEHTGLLLLYNGKFVKFRHDSYMEYFAAKEIFKNHRHMEKDLVNNFFDVNWQFAAIFYGGMTRKMPDFLSKITKKISTSKTMNEYWSSTNGMGYILQALYLTDDAIRKNGVREVLNIMLETYQGFKKISSSLPQNILFGSFSLPILSIFPIFMFYDNFDSITLKQPLSLALEELIEEYDEKKTIENYPYIDNIIYQIMILAVTLSSNRLQTEDKLTDIIGRIDTTGNEFYTRLLEAAIENLGSSKLREQKNQIIKPQKVRKTKGNSYHLKQKIDTYLQPSVRHRYGKYDKIIPKKKIKLFVEGPSDAILMEHAYTVLTGHIPYWEIRVGNLPDGGASGLAKALNEGISYLEDDEMVIGIFDNDRGGIPQFKGTLHKTKFDYVDGERVKKRKGANIWAMLLPIPHEMQHYIQSDHNYCYFSIEHYILHEYLERSGILKNSPLPNIYQIRDTKGTKKEFADNLAKRNDIELFKGFTMLFKEIDNITGMSGEIDYQE